jgi:aspartate racemase
MKKTIGMIGGMGPLATADLLKKIVLMTDAGCDNDHIRVFIDNNTNIPDRTSAILRGGKDPVADMTDSIRVLERCGADCLVMPCNTAHYFLPRLKELTSLPFLSMLEVTAKACAVRYPGKTAAILGTRGTLQTGIYADALSAERVAYILPDEGQKDVLMDAIYGVKGGVDLETVRVPMEALISEMQTRGADYFILGCTELPIVAQELKLKAAFIDPTSELARSAIEFCGYKVKE